jgi:serine protease Do
MKYTQLAMVAAIMIFAGTSMAQDAKKPAEKKVEKKEIIVENKGTGMPDKMVIIVEDGKVTINGKPAEEYKGRKEIVIDEKVVIDGQTMTVPRNGRVIVRGGEPGQERALLGVVTEKTDKGVKVTEVSPESAAAKAGLKAGDIITTFNGKKIGTEQELVDAVRAQKPDDQVDVAFLRDGKEKKVKATLGKTSDDFSFNWNWDGDFDVHPPMAMTIPRGRFSPRVYEFNNQDMWMYRSDRPKFGMSIQDYEDGDGVQVNEVEENSSAAKGGLKKGDIIVEVDGQAVKSVDSLKNSLGDLKDKTSVEMKILRDGKPQALNIRVPKKIKTADL